MPAPARGSVLCNEQGGEGEGSTDWAGEVGSGLSWAVQLSLALLKRGRKNIFNSLDYCHGSSFLPESFPPSFFRASPLDGVDVWVLNTKLRDATGLRIGPVRLVLKLADKLAEAVLL